MILQICFSATLKARYVNPYQRPYDACVIWNKTSCIFSSNKNIFHLYLTSWKIGNERQAERTQIEKSVVVTARRLLEHLLSQVRVKGQDWKVQVVAKLVQVI